ncbi:hypothetical protein ABPG74_014156 [Tetrahymena malaccensis]
MDKKDSSQRSSSADLFQINKKLKSSDKKLNSQIKKTHFVQQQTEKYEKINHLLKHEEQGYLEAEGMEKTLAFKQHQLKNLLPIQNAEKIFDLKLDWGQYSIDYTRNGNHLLLGGSKGHLAMMDWHEKKLACEIQVKESIRDVKFLHDEKMFAVAQKKYVYVYDNQGIELHKLKNHLEPSHLEYLPYHFLLVSASRLGFLKYHDTSTGSIVAEYRMNVREPVCMKQNPYNAIIGIGDNKGCVNMYSPNTSEPLVKMLCHKGNVNSLAFDKRGFYMVTAGTDGLWKVWDLRTYKLLHDYFAPSTVSHLDISQSGVLALSYGCRLQLWKDWQLEKQKQPYMKHESFGYNTITDTQFVPYEDFLGLGIDGGFQSIVVPGAGEANFDAFESNPYQTKKQAREGLVKKLLEKIPSTTISLNPNRIGTIDTASKEVIQAEEKAEKQEREKNQIKKKKNKMRGKNKASKVEARKEFSRQEEKREKAKEAVDIKIRARNAEKEKKSQELKVLNKLDSIDNFDPIYALKKQKKLN